MFKTIIYLQRLDDYGVGFISFKEEHLATDNDLVRNILLAMLSSFAQLEAKKISERTKAGLDRARRRGKKLGRPVDKEMVEHIRKLKAEGLSDSQVIKKLKISRNTVKKYKQV